MVLLVYLSAEAPRRARDLLVEALGARCSDQMLACYLTTLVANLRTFPGPSAGAAFNSAGQTGHMAGNSLARLLIARAAGSATILTKLYWALHLAIQVGAQ